MAKRRKRRRPSSSPTKRNKTKPKEGDANLCFQDIWNDHCSASNHADAGPIDSDAVSDVFFELANAPSVSYRLEAPPSKGSSLRKYFSSYKDRDETEEIENGASGPTRNTHSKTLTTNPASNTIVIEQDVSGAAQTHTGGIVWETSYLLLNYLLSSNGWLNTTTTTTTSTPRTILEIGAGCGMLGLSLHKAFQLGIIGDGENDDGDSSLQSSRVILTETNEVMDNLRKNFERNYPPPPLLVVEDETIPAHDVPPALPHASLSVEELDWTRCREDCARAKLKARSVDCIVGTDVVFSTRFVRPMLETMRFLSHPRTTVYLCLQERCKDSHELLLEEAIHYGFQIVDISETVYNDAEMVHSCGFGRALECKLLKFTVVDSEKEDGQNEKKKWKKEKKKKKKKGTNGNKN